jgi:hypothetical protein
VSGLQPGLGKRALSSALRLEKAKRARAGSFAKARPAAAAEGGTLALILSHASLWFSLLEGRKIYELRRHKVRVPGGCLRVLLITCKAVRQRFGLSCRMAEAECTLRLGPFTAEEIIANPALRGGVLASDEEIRRLLPVYHGGVECEGYLYQLRRTRMSRATWCSWRGNGSNGHGFLQQQVDGKLRWTEPAQVTQSKGPRATRAVGP